MKNSENKKSERIFCQRCNQVLHPNRITWLELSNTDGNYYNEVPSGHTSQGAFPFGSACGKAQLKGKEISNEA